MEGRSEFEYGDQDYGSAFGWDPDEEDRKLGEEALVKAKKKNPRVWTERPEIVYVRKARDTQRSWKGEEQTKQLFGPFWKDRELAVLFGQTGIGKSALAMQIAECLARDITMPPFKAVESYWPEKNVVLYLDFELSDRQLTERYSKPNDGKITSTHLLAPGIHRGELCWNGDVKDGYDDFTDMLLEDIGQCVIDVNANFLIIDNLTFLTRGSAVNSTVAFRMMERLKKIRDDLGISVLALAHTPKFKEPHAITENDLQGSIDISKVADSIFCIAKSGEDSSFRYLKQIKSRSAEIEYGDNKVVILKLGKFDFRSTYGQSRPRNPVENFLGYTFITTDVESKHIPKVQEDAPPIKRTERISKLSTYAKRLADEGLSAGQIANKLGIGRATAHRFISRQTPSKDGHSEQRRSV